MARLTWVGPAVAALAGGCATAPPVDNPVLVRSAPAGGVENPVLVSPGAPTGVSYREVFETCLDVLDDHFEVLDANPYAGVITTRPAMAPGFEQFWKAGNPDARERLLSTFQTIRKTATVTLRTGDRGGYLVSVQVVKELEDLPRPTRAVVGAVFQEAPTVDRQVEVVGPGAAASRVWFPVGRDYALEQELLQRIREGR